MTELTKLVIVWTSGNPEVAEHMTFMYAHNSLKHGWWEHVRLLVWGPSQPLLVQNAGLQARVKAMQEDGVEVVACKACADEYGIAAEVEALGVPVFYVGKLLTESLKGGWASLTF